MLRGARVAHGLAQAAQALPVEAEGPVTFLVGMIGGLALAFSFTKLAGLIVALTP